MLRIILPVLALLGLAKGTKRRRIINHFSGKTPQEARTIIVERVSRRTDDTAKADAIADRIVAKLSDRGILAPA